jgi:hypothetical protein
MDIALELGDSLAERLRRFLTEVRIDVALPEARLGNELAVLERRLPDMIDVLEPMSGIEGLSRGLAVRMREADGERFIYVIDTERDVLAAYVTMNRLVEVNRRADRHLRSPHSKVAEGYRRRGIVSSIYRAWLDSGRSLMSGARQSPAARALWTSLAHGYPSCHVRLDDRRVRLLPEGLPEAVYAQLEVRRVLLGNDCRMEEFVDVP